MQAHNYKLARIGTVRAPVFGRHQFFGTLEHYGRAHGSLLSGWMNYNYTARCWFPTSSNILILPSQFWQIRFESCWLHCSKCWILCFYSTCSTSKHAVIVSKGISILLLSAQLPIYRDVTVSASVCEKKSEVI